MSLNPSQTITLDDVRMEPVLVNDVPVPDRLLFRARDDRNLPIPGVVAVVNDVKDHSLTHGSFVDYDHLDWNAWAVIASQKRCGYCRHELDYWIYFVGHQAEVYAKAFMNPAMHDVCAHYFLQVYPTVFMPRMRDVLKREGGRLPTRLGVYKTRAYKIMSPYFEGTIPKYMLQAGTQKGPTMWVEYPRELMDVHHQDEQAALRPTV